jgi:hypothetical protein
MPNHDSREGQLNAVIDPKLLFLAKVAARHEGMALNEFIEEALKLALSTSTVASDEPNPGHVIQRPKQRASLRFETLWHDDDVERLFRVGLHNPKLLAPKQRVIYDHVIQSLIQQRKKITLKNCVESINAAERE